MKQARGITKVSPASLVFAAVVALVATGCGSQSETPPVKASPLLVTWAGSVCRVFSDHKMEVDAISADVTAMARAIERHDGLRVLVVDNASQIATRERMQADLRKFREAELRLLTKLTARRAPKTEAGRQGQHIADFDGIALIRDGLNHLDRIETQLMKLPPHPKPATTANMVGFLGTGADYRRPSSLVALRVKVSKNAELRQAFKDAYACQSWEHHTPPGWVP